MATKDQLGTLPLSVLTARPSLSAERSKRAEIEAELRMSPLKRAEVALRLGRELAAVAKRHDPTNRSRPSK